MSVELNWREGEESGDVAWGELDASTAPEPARTIVRGARSRPKRSRTALPFLLAVLAGILIGSAALAAFLVVRTNQSSELARQDIEAALALLLDAQANGDVSGYAELLDPNEEVWRSRRIAGLRRTTDAPVQTNVESVRLQGDLALAELTGTAADGGEVATRTAFFRFHNGRWLLTAPVAEQFGAQLQQSSPHFLIEYRKADEPAIHSLVDLVEGSYVVLCGELRCRTSERPIPLVLSYEENGAAIDAALQVTSPRLTGVDGRGQPGESFERELTGALAIYLAAARFPATSPALRAAVAEWAVAELSGATSPEMTALRQAERRDDLLPLDRVWRLVAVRNENGALEQTQVASMFIYAQETFGNGAVARLLEATPADLPDALRRAYGVSYDDFNAGWQEWLQAGSPAADRPA
ncbi:MAG: hypothetical protein KDI55_17340 [Anaerolineae bacterium]|nr:hypothetical protein [Anaerolineae bacterium]